MPANSPDARTLSPEAQKEKRTTALRMREQGYTFRSIADALGVHLRTVQHWLSVSQSQGAKAAIAGGRRGASFGQGRILSPEQEVMVRGWIIDRMPDQLKLPFALWTRAAVRELIREKLGLVLPLVTVGLYLQRWDFTAQRPWQRALERRPAEVAHWLEHEYPAIAKRAKREGATILWGDETGVIVTLGHPHPALPPPGGGVEFGAAAQAGGVLLVRQVHDVYAGIRHGFGMSTIRIGGAQEACFFRQ